MNPSARDAIVRSLCFHEAWSYAPTRAECISVLDVGIGGVPSREDAVRAMEDALRDGMLKEIDGRIGFPVSVERIVRTIRERDALQPRKRRRAISVARYLARLGGVRFVALANTTALGSARDEGDLDFFIIAKKGSIWSTRLFGAAPFRLLQWTPAPGRERDAVCLSYFISDDGLDLSSHTLTPDDPYFRHWFLSLLPLYDDGVSAEFWNANAALRHRHPFAETWIAPPDLAIPRPAFRIPTRIIESLAKKFQMRWFPSAIRERMNTDTTVMVTDQALKFHVTDNRAEYRSRYEEACRTHGVDV